MKMLPLLRKDEWCLSYGCNVMYPECIPNVSRIQRKDFYEISFDNTNFEV